MAAADACHELNLVVVSDVDFPTLPKVFIPERCAVSLAALNDTVDLIQGKFDKVFSSVAVHDQFVQPHGSADISLGRDADVDDLPEDALRGLSVRLAATLIAVVDLDSYGWYDLPVPGRGDPCWASRAGPESTPDHAQALFYLRQLRVIDAPFPTLESAIRSPQSWDVERLRDLLLLLCGISLAQSTMKERSRSAGQSGALKQATYIPGFLSLLQDKFVLGPQVPSTSPAVVAAASAAASTTASAQGGIQPNVDVIKSVVAAAMASFEARLLAQSAAASNPKAPAAARHSPAKRARLAPVTDGKIPSPVHSPHVFYSLPSSHGDNCPVKLVDMIKAVCVQKAPGSKFPTLLQTLGMLMPDSTLASVEAFSTMTKLPRIFEWSRWPASFRLLLALSYFEFCMHLPKDSERRY